MGFLDYIPAIASVVGAFVSKDESDDAVKKATNVSAAATKEANQLMIDYLTQNRSDIADAVAQGRIDLNAGFDSAMEGLSAGVDTGTVDHARDLATGKKSITEDPSYQFQTQVGNQAANSLLTKAPGGGTPSMKGSAEEYGANYAKTFMNEIINRYLPRVNRSFGASVNMANTAAGRGKDLANLGIGGPTKTAQMTGSTSPIIAQNIGSIRRDNVASGIMLDNNRTNLYSNLMNVANQTSALLMDKGN